MSSHPFKRTPQIIKDSLLQIDAVAIFEAAITSMLILSPDGTILFANAEAIKKMNTNDGIVGMQLNRLLHGKSRINFKRWYNNALENKNLTNLFLVPLIHNKDDVSWTNVKLSLLESKSNEKLILCQISDCSENKKEVEEAKAQHENLLLQLINNIPDNIFFKDLESRFILANDSTSEKLKHRSSVHLIGKTDFDIHPKKLAQKYYNDEQEIISTGQARLNIIEQVLNSQNNIEWHSTSKLPLRDQNGDIIGIMGIARDITQWVKEQKTLRKAKLAAEKADHLKTSFLSNFTHEIRTPLNGILGFSQYLKQTLRPEHKGHKYIDFILHNGKRLLHLISDIIDLSRIESGEIALLKKGFSLNEVMNQLKQSTLQQLSSLKKEKIKLDLKMELEDSNSMIYSDDSRLKQVLYNLLNNAVKFTNKGKISFGYRLERDHLFFYVKDTGIGIDSKNLKVIFESFRQVDHSETRQYEGAGIGLSIAQGLVILFGGRISVQSEPDKGSEFYFSIPREYPPAEQ